MLLTYYMLILVLEKNRMKKAADESSTLEEDK